MTNKVPVYIIYTTRQAHTQSSYSVARLCALLCEHLIAEGFEAWIFSPAGETDSTAPYAKAVHLPSGIMPKISRAASKIQRHKSDPFDDYILNEAIDFAARKGHQQTAVFITPNLGVSIALLNKVEAGKIFYWIHNYPGLNSLGFFLKVITQPLHAVFPSQALYDLVWERLYENTLPFYGHIIQNLVTGNKVQAILPKPGGRLVLLHAGGLSHHKGIHVLKNALLLLPKDQQAKLEFWYIGSEHRDYMLQQIACREFPMLEPNDLHQLCMQADVGVLPSLWFENAPILLNEYLQHGLIVLCSNAGGMPEMLSGYQGQIIDRPNLAEGWLQALNRLLDVSQEQITSWKTGNQEKFYNASANRNASIIATWKQALSSASMHG